MPNTDDPDDSPLDSVEEPIRPHDHFAVREIGKLRDDAAGVREAFQPSQDLFGTLAESLGGAKIVAAEVFNHS